MINRHHTVVYQFQVNRSHSLLHSFKRPRIRDAEYQSTDHQAHITFRLPNMRDDTFEYSRLMTVAVLTGGLKYRYVSKRKYWIYIYLFERLMVEHELLSKLTHSVNTPPACVCIIIHTLPATYYYTTKIHTEYIYRIIWYRAEEAELTTVPARTAIG